MDLVSEQKQERRERILDGARALIAERDYAAITVRELARRCRVSVPTLYNLFGGKDEVLAAAVEAHMRALLSDRVSEGEPGHERIFELVERCAAETARLADYHRSLLRAFAEVRETEPLQETLAVALTTALASELAAMRQRRRLASWVRPDVLASQITSACISASVVWAKGALGDAGLQASMVHATGLMLLGAARGAVREEIERRTRSAQELLASELANATNPRRGGASPPLVRKEAPI